MQFTTRVSPSPTSIAVEEKGVHTMLASSAYQIEVGEDAKRERRTSEDVEKMFKKLRIPFTLSDNGVFELEGGEKVLPPYRPSEVEGTNVEVVKRIRAFLLQE
mmetsp:Transcript_5993/g.14552  ORF Transcript_5993/g.14552 Transcript_5993/m.14552 type:complete len:103 (-) Transcript_5993:56-364(-)